MLNFLGLVFPSFGSFLPCPDHYSSFLLSFSSFLFFLIFFTSFYLSLLLFFSSFRSSFLTFFPSPFLQPHYPSVSLLLPSIRTRPSFIHHLYYILQSFQTFILLYLLPCFLTSFLRSFLGPLSVFSSLPSIILHFLTSFPPFLLLFISISAPLSFHFLALLVIEPYPVTPPFTLLLFLLLRLHQSPNPPYTPSLQLPSVLCPPITHSTLPSHTSFYSPHLLLLSPQSSNPAHPLLYLPPTLSPRYRTLQPLLLPLLHLVCGLVPGSDSQTRQLVYANVAMLSSQNRIEVAKRRRKQKTRKTTAENKRMIPISLRLSLQDRKNCPWMLKIVTKKSLDLDRISLNWQHFLAHPRESQRLFAVDYVFVELDGSL